MSELKPCPFCGGEAALVPTRETTVREWFVTCDNLECNVLVCCTKRYYTEAEAIEAWNTRADDYRQAADYWKRAYEETIMERTCSIEEPDELPYPVCSECGAIQPDDYMVYYCWSCGAKVVGE